MAFTIPEGLHPDLNPLAWMIGTWRGAEKVRQTHPGINLSTVYRNLETLENVGLVQHTHLGHGGATYHAAEELTHLHLVCGTCGSVGDAPIDVAANFVQNLSDDYGFKTDVTHFAIYGTCAACVK